MVIYSGKPVEWGQGEENTSFRFVFSEPSSFHIPGRENEQKTGVEGLKSKFPKPVKIYLHLK